MKIKNMFGQPVIALTNGFAHSKGQDGYIDDVVKIGKELYYNIVLDGGMLTGLVCSSEFKIVDDMV